MATMVRQAQADDVPAMVELSEKKRAKYQEYQPTFWRKAADSREKQIPFFEHQLSRENVIALVHEDARVIDGFVLAMVVPAPPVYNPGGLTCVIDDYCVAHDSDWGKVGTALLNAAAAEAKARGAVLVAVVSGHADEAKRSMLRSLDLTIASEWWVREI